MKKQQPRARMASLLVWMLVGASAATPFTNHHDRRRHLQATSNTQIAPARSPVNVWSGSSTTTNTNTDNEAPTTPEEDESSSTDSPTTPLDDPSPSPTPSPSLFIAVAPAAVASNNNSNSNNTAAKAPVPTPVVATLPTAAPATPTLFPMRSPTVRPTQAPQVPTVIPTLSPHWDTSNVPPLPDIAHLTARKTTQPTVAVSPVTAPVTLPVTSPVTPPPPVTATTTIRPTFQPSNNSEQEVADGAATASNSPTIAELSPGQLGDDDESSRDEIATLNVEGTVAPQEDTNEDVGADDTTKLPPTTTAEDDTPFVVDPSLPTSASHANLVSTDLPDIRILLRMSLPDENDSSSNYEETSSIVTSSRSSTIEDPTSTGEVVQNTLRDFFQDLIRQTPRAELLVQSDLQILLYDGSTTTATSSSGTTANEPAATAKSQDRDDPPSEETSDSTIPARTHIMIEGTLWYNDSSPAPVTTANLAQHWQTFFSFWGTDALTSTLQSAGVPVEWVWIQVDHSWVGRPSQSFEESPPGFGDSLKDVNESKKHTTDYWWRIWLLGILLLLIAIVMVAVGLAVCRFVRVMNEDNENNNRQSVKAMDHPPASPTASSPDHPSTASSSGLPANFPREIFTSASFRHKEPTFVVTDENNSADGESLSNEVIFRSDFFDMANDSAQLQI